METQPKPPISSAATDLTLLFGAESYIRSCAGEVLADPEGEVCLKTLVDLIVNCNDLYLPLPGADVGQESGLLQGLKQHNTLERLMIHL